MSRIGENIRKITKAWGGKTTGSGIGDALEDLYNNLPFCTKTEKVEIVPLQSVTTDEVDMYGYCQYLGGFTFNEWHIAPNRKYTVAMNGKEYDFIAEANGDEGAGLGDGENPPFSVYCAYGEDQLDMTWSVADYGKTITLAIYEEQEVVTPIDIKYLPIEELKTALGISQPE